MNFEQLLKNLGFTDEQIKTITEGMDKNKIYTTSLEKADERYNKLKGQKDDVDGQLKTANETIEGLKKANKDNETLQATIKTHEATIDTLKKDSEAKIKKLTLDTAISNALVRNKAKFPDLLVTKFDREKLVIGEDGKVIGLDEQIKTFKESYKELFGETVEGNDPNNKNTDPTGVKNPWSKEHFNLTEQGKLLKEKPELAKQLMASAK